MRTLLDVSCLVALLDPTHEGFVRTRDWLRAHIDEGWASCSITQLGAVRILSQPRYPATRDLSVALAALRRATSTAAHEFWLDDVELVDTGVVDPGRLLGPAQLTDVHLLALAKRRDGRLLTLDRRISTSAVVGATAAHLVTL